MKSGSGIASSVLLPQTENSMSVTEENTWGKQGPPCEEWAEWLCCRTADICGAGSHPEGPHQHKLWLGLVSDTQNMDRNCKYALSQNPIQFSIHIFVLLNIYYIKGKSQSISRMKR